MQQSSSTDPQGSPKENSGKLTDHKTPTTARKSGSQRKQTAESPPSKKNNHLVLICDDCKTPNPDSEENQVGKSSNDVSHDRELSPVRAALLEITRTTKNLLPKM